MGALYYMERLRESGPADRAVQLLRAAADFSVSLEDNEALRQLDREQCNKEAAR